MRTKKKLASTKAEPSAESPVLGPTEVDLYVENITAESYALGALDFATPSLTVHEKKELAADEYSLSPPEARAGPPS